jgi:alpha-L-fucosidase 2
LKYHEGSGVYPNFFDAHPPFQIDGNFGFTAGVAEMLLQSHLGVLHLLPALPADWASGSISGLKARGNVEVGITWKNGALLQCTLRPTVSGIYVVRYKNRDVKLNLKANRIYRLNQLLKL